MKNSISRWQSVAVAIISAAISWIIYWGTARAWGTNEAALTATVLLFSIFFHELCHAVVLESSGVKTLMVFMAVGAGVMPVPQAVARYKDLHSSRMAAVTLAGVTGNLVIALAATAMKSAGILNASWTDWIRLTNAGLIGLNLLPAGTLDGGRFARLLFDSVSEDHDYRFARLMGAVIMLAVGLTIAFHHRFTPLAPLIIIQLYKRANDDDPWGSASKKAMTLPQQRAWATAYIALFCTATILGT
ncbi:hypothetical protein A2752_01785 [Candidatus Uhrbacteria bacterium RIFCSPHIGHO2_01_FULL_46_23]|nr:MAG: hypothetical protein A2752_01785 [Candidatus Uhrbacteria bacterium RIFCSPHIGHO2_01_FULL_46_23]